MGPPPNILRDLLPTSLGDLLKESPRGPPKETSRNILEDLPTILRDLFPTTRKRPQIERERASIERV